MSNEIKIANEPEIKGSNKAPEFQSAVIRARKNGCTDALEVAEAIYDWHMDSARTVQIATLHYAVARIWATAEAKMEAAPASAPALSRKQKTKAAEAKAFKANVRADLDKKWLDVVIPMTGAQVRAAKMLPDDMAKKVGDNQRVGEVFTAAQLRAAIKEGARD